MIKKLHLFIAFILITAIPLSAQRIIHSTHNAEEPCASDHQHERLMNTDLLYKQRILDNEKAIQQIIQSGQKNGGIYTIPVVVHVIHTGEPVGIGVNISDAQIHSAINNMNDAYRNRGGYQGVDTEIEFCLAVRDPNGQPTSGIVRVDGSGVTNYATQGITAGQGQGANEVSVKNLSRWSNTSYYNIWVVNEIENNDGGSGIQGYAYFPGAQSSVDGTVNLYNAFGYDPNGSLGYDLKIYTRHNTVLIHELGHGLNLYHTFQGDNNGNNCPANSSCSNDGDRICDTPPHIRSASNCNTSGTNSCDGGSSNTLFVHNFMDYSSNICQNRFTSGQKDRMRAAISGLRSGLLNSEGCMPIYSLDAGIAEVIEPSGTTCLTSVAPRVMLSNYGSNTLTSVDINYNLNGGQNSTYNWTGSLSSNSSVLVTLPSINILTGSHTFNIFTSSPNGGSDQNTVNDAASSLFTALSPIIGQALPLTEGFQNTTFAPTEWSISNPNSDVTWIRTTAAGGFGNSSASAIMNNFDNDTRGTVDYLYTPYLDLIGVSEATLTFNVAYARYNAQFHDSLIVMVSYDCGGSWNRVYAKGSSGLATAPDNQSLFTPSSGQWREETVNLNDYIGYSGIQIAFMNKGGYGNRLFIDDVNIESPLSGPPPVAEFEASETENCSGTSITFTDLSTDASSWSWNFGAGAIPATANGQGPHNVTYTTAGQKTVSLTATGPGGNNTETKTDYITVSRPTTSATVNHLTCNGDSNGAIDLTVSNGIAPYTYLWSPGGATTEDLNNIGANTYSVTVTDEWNCQVVANISVNQPSALSINSSKTDASCDANDGSATANVSGGVPPYTYLWTPGSETTSSLINLAPNTYNIQITDNNGCQANQNVIVNQIQCGPTKLRNADCGISLTTFDQRFYCDKVSATNYEYQFTDILNGDVFTRVRGSSANDMRCTWVSGIKYGRTYNVRVRALVGGQWTEFGVTCQITTPVYPGTQLIAGDCNSTLTTFDQQIFCDPIIGASNYEWEFVHTGSGFSTTRLRGNGYRNMYCTWVPGLKYGLTYQVRVRSFVGGEWTDYGSVCSLTTPGNPGSKLIDSDCNSTLNTFDQQFFCDPISGATNYEWEFVHAGSGFSTTRLRGNGYRNMYCTWVPGLKYGFTYDVRIRAYVGSEWTDYGSVCSLTTPAYPGTQLRSDFCGTSVSMTTSFFCDLVLGATNYEWEFVNGQTTLIRQRGSTSREMRLSWVTGAQAGTTYDVRVRAFVGGEWTSFGPVCSLSSSSGMIVNDQDVDYMDIIASDGYNTILPFEVKVYPNPVGANNNLNIFVTNLNNEMAAVTIYDLTGRKVVSEMINTKLIISDKLSSGIYLLEVILDGQRYMEKIIVR
jgi:PKD repeat protein